MTSHESGHAARLLVLVDEDGNIVAASGPAGHRPLDRDTPTDGGVRPSKGRTLHEVVVPEELKNAGTAESLGNFYVARDGDQPRLARRSPQG
ncbi:hypothetical protein [Kitasatospora sp. NPDC088351]|uniref:hypothetical protein n=1 Tax=unclassified Kitasatospora TaxID=2633591 RepID=UPI003449FC96